jgi:hypothetical protein
MANFKSGEILVCTKTQCYSCGKLKLRKGAIVQACKDSNHYGEIEIKRYNRDYSPTFEIEIANMRLGNNEEVFLWNTGVSTIKDLEEC